MKIEGERLVIVSSIRTSETLKVIIHCLRYGGVLKTKHPKIWVVVTSKAMSKVALEVKKLTQPNFKSLGHTTINRDASG